MAFFNDFSRTRLPETLQIRLDGHPFRASVAKFAGGGEDRLGVPNPNQVAEYETVRAMALREDERPQDAIALLSAIPYDELQPLSRVRYRCLVALCCDELGKAPDDFGLPSPTAADIELIDSTDLGWVYTLTTAPAFDKRRFQGAVKSEELRRAVQWIPILGIVSQFQHILLFSGEWGRAFNEVPSSWFTADWPAHRRWTGQSLSGKSVLLLLYGHGGGNGDTVNFCWFAVELLRRGASRVVLRVSESTKELISRSLPSVEVVAEANPDDFDFCTDWLGAWQGLVSTGEAFNPPTSYIKADRRIELPPSDRLRVGFCWIASDSRFHALLRHDVAAKAERLPLWMRDSSTLESIRVRIMQRVKDAGIHDFSLGRTIEPEAFAGAFFGEALRDRVEWVSLAVGAGDDWLKGYPILDMRDRIQDFSDTASIIDQCDLVVSTDTAVAHIAGAMGKPVWLLLNYLGECPWGITGRSSVWYPSMRLYRQSRLGDWIYPVFEVKEDLLKLLDARG